MKKLNTAIIGYGLSGRVFHAPIITSLKQFDLSLIYTTNQDSINDIKTNYPLTKVTNDVYDIFNSKSIDLVIIATPNNLHYEYAKKVLNSGKHVIVEKPFTITSKEAEDLIELSKEQKRVLTVYHNRRFDSDFKTVKKIIESGKLGKLVEYEAHFDRFRNYLKNSWKEENQIGSGTIYDLGPHLIDQALMLFGEPKEVFADLRIQRDCAKTIDNFEIILFYENLKVTLKSGMLVKANLPKYLLFGEQGSFVKYGIDIQEKELSLGKRPIDESWGEEPESIWGELYIDGIEKIKSEKGDYREFYINIYDSIVNNKEIQVTPEQARNTIRIIELAILSNKELRVVNYY